MNGFTPQQQSIIDKAKADFERNVRAAPLVHVFTNLFEGFTYTRGAYTDATMHASLEEAAEEAVEDHYCCTVMIDPVTRAVTLLDLSARGEELFQERRRDRESEEAYARDCSSLELAGRV